MFGPASVPTKSLRSGSPSSKNVLGPNQTPWTWFAASSKRPRGSLPLSSGQGKAWPMLPQRFSRTRAGFATSKTVTVRRPVNMEEGTSSLAEAVRKIIGAAGRTRTVPTANAQADASSRTATTGEAVVTLQPGSGRTITGCRTAPLRIPDPVGG